MHDVIWRLLRKPLFVLHREIAYMFMNRVTVGLGSTRARASIPRVGQGWTGSGCRSTGWIGHSVSSDGMNWTQRFVWRIEFTEIFVRTNVKPEKITYKNSRVECSFWGFELSQSILFDELAWMAESCPSPSVLALGLGFGFCSSGRVGSDWKKVFELNSTITLFMKRMITASSARNVDTTRLRKLHNTVETTR